MSLTITEIIMYSTIQIRMMNDLKQIIGYATGFLASFCKTKEDFVPALVTNRHVLDKTSFVQLVFTRKKEDGNPDVGNKLAVTLDTAEAIFHPSNNVDLAILPVARAITLCRSQETPIFCPFINTTHIPTPENWNAFDALERVVMAGYPEGFGDEVNNLPIFRSGFTATHPGYNFRGKPEFLVDVPCFHGCSGSPIYLLGRNFYTGNINLNKPLGTDRFFLLGIQYAIPNITKHGQLKDKHGYVSGVTSIIPLHLDLGFAIKSSELLAFESILAQMNVSSHRIVEGIRPGE